MLLLLPPSETKRPGGDPSRPLDLGSLAHARELSGARRAALAELRALSSNLTTAAAALGLGPGSAGQAALNREVRRGPTMSALDRFDGVLYDALDTATLSTTARERAADRVLVASALFGLLGPEDAVPAYRLSAGTRLPGRPLRTIWREAIAGVLGRHDGLIVDLRSEAYAALGPLPERDDAVFLRVVTEGPDGSTRALNHFNKHGKGELVRALLESADEPTTVDELLDTIGRAGMTARRGAAARRGAPGEVDLVV
jgi:uncharacterized protein